MLMWENVEACYTYCSRMFVGVCVYVTEFWDRVMLSVTLFMQDIRFISERLSKGTWHSWMKLWFFWVSLVDNWEVYLSHRISEVEVLGLFISIVCEVSLNRDGWFVCGLALWRPRKECGCLALWWGFRLGYFYCWAFGVGLLEHGS